MITDLSKETVGTKADGHTGSKPIALGFAMHCARDWNSNGQCVFHWQSNETKDSSAPGERVLRAVAQHLAARLRVPAEPAVVAAGVLPLQNLLQPVAQQLRVVLWVQVVRLQDLQKAARPSWCS